LDLGVKLWIFHIKWTEYQIRGALNNRIIACENVESTVFNISRSELRTSNCHFNVVTLTNENGRFDWANEEGAIVASVDSYLSNVIKYVNLTIGEAGYFKLHTVYVSWHFHEGLV